MARRLSALRPHIDALFQKELYDAFLRNSPSSRRFQIEDWSEKWIRSQPLDSDSLAKCQEAAALAPIVSDGISDNARFTATDVLYPTGCWTSEASI
jgi:hypothetical protein